MLLTRDSLQIERHIQTGSEGMEKYIPCKYKWQQYSYQEKNLKFKTKKLCQALFQTFYMILLISFSR